MDHYVNLNFPQRKIIDEEGDYIDGPVTLQMCIHPPDDYGDGDTAAGSLIIRYKMPDFIIAGDNRPRIDNIETDDTTNEITFSVLFEE